MIAIQQLAVSLEEKIFQYVAGDRLQEWLALDIFDIEDLDKMTNSYFQDRWQTFKTKFQIDSVKLQKYIRYVKDIVLQLPHPCDSEKLREIVASMKRSVNLQYLIDSNEEVSAFLAQDIMQNDGIRRIYI